MRLASDSPLNHPVNTSLSAIHLSAISKSREKVLGYPVDIIDRDTALSIIESSWHAGKGLNVVTLNAEMVIAAQKDSELDRIIRHSSLIIADGAGVVWALKLYGHNVERLPGIELADATLELASKLGKKVSLIGGKKEVLEALLEVVKKRYPGITLGVCHHGYFAEDTEEILQEISQSEPDLVLVALGVPRQEFFIDQNRNSYFPKSILIGVGGSFDVWTGNVKRAPELMRKLNLEWLWRLMKEPWRANRMASALPNFAFQVILEKFLPALKTR
jgi:N-acetylglucosaminyldiphosphoundecaprenol N-acetyl-beta-D-mannosaminyltransferase